MVRIELMSWEEARAQSSPIRFTVFCEEQGVPREIELDEHDAACVHALAFEGSKAVGTARLLPDGHIGRMAVLKEWRGQGIGGFMLTRLMARAKERGDREVVLSGADLETHVERLAEHGRVQRRAQRERAPAVR